MTGDEIELAFIREFQVLGCDLSDNVGRLARMERIRIGIFRERREDRQFCGTEMTYAQAFKKCFGKNAELRSIKRDQIGMPIRNLIDELEDET
jgi:hypothetical protein